jgi:hypothetical protein
MEQTFESFLKRNLMLLTDFVLAKNKHASRSRIYNEINQLFQPALVGVMPKLLAAKLTIQMKQTSFGNNILYMEGDDAFNNNRFIIETCSKSILGVENDAGDVEPLTKDLIETCHKYKLTFVMPLNLNNTLDDDKAIDDQINELDMDLNHAESDDDNDTE